MTFGMFVTWVLVGVLAGVLGGLVMKPGGHGLKRDVTLGLVGAIGLGWLFRASGMYPEAGIVTMAVVACIGAAVPIVVQRRFWPADSPADEKGAMLRWGLGGALVIAVGWMIFGPAPQPAASAAVIEEKAYAVTPAAITVKAGLLTGEVTDLKVAERVEQGSDRIVTPARLTAMLRLKNTSADQTVRLLDARMEYIDGQGRPIALEDMRTEPTLRFSTPSGERLDPGQEATQSVDVEFPAEALKANRLKEIRLQLVYIPSPYRAETVNFAVSIGAGK